MELQSLSELEKATRIGRQELFRLGTALLFVVGIMIFTSLQMQSGARPIPLLVVAAHDRRLYGEVNIGANDVANNVGPAVGSKAITLTGAIIIAAIFEASGALIAGGDVVSTIKKGIIDPSMINDANTFIWLMDRGPAGGGDLAEHRNCVGRAGVYDALDRRRRPGCSASPPAAGRLPIGDRSARLPPAG